MSVIHYEKKGWVKWKYTFLILLPLMSIPILIFFDTPIWELARDLVEPDYLYIPELLTHWGIISFLFYLLKQTKYAGCRFLPLIYAFLIAISRVFVSSHYPSDVAAGMAIGILGAWFFISRCQRHGN